VSLAKSMKLRIISEGIETALQCSQLTALGCDLGQGYLFARPISAEGLECILSKHSLENAITLKAA